MNNFIKNNTGLLICIGFLLILFLLNIPINLSVVCANENQGFAFTFGEGLLRWKELACGRGILFVSLFASILKIFGFNTYSIIAVHILETIILLLIGVLIYLIVSKSTKNNFLGGLSTALWVIMISTPIGTSGLQVEILSHYNLNEENLCVLFSLSSLLCMVVSNFFNPDKGTLISRKEKLFSFLAGVFTVCSLMSKANGAILLIATVLWFLLLFAFRKQEFKFLSTKILYYFSGAIFSLSLFNIVLYILSGDLVHVWKDYFLLGNYTNEHLTSVKLLLSMVLKFMTRYTNSISNFVLFFFGLLLFILGILKWMFQKEGKNNLTNFWLLIGIWGLGNVCVIIAPGGYQPYYYHLIWPSLSIVFVIGLHELFLFLRVQKAIIFFVSLLVIAFFSHRICLSASAHYHIAREHSTLSVFNQPQSFQDPVLPYNPKLNYRPYQLILADGINVHLPDKNNTFYILAFSDFGLTAINPLTYIYSKRASPTTVDFSLLAVPTIIEMKLKVLKRDLFNRKPDVLIISTNIPLRPWQVQYLSPFLAWVQELIKSSYHFETSFNLAVTNDKTETFFVYRKIKQ